MDFTRQWDICTPHLIQNTSVTLIGTGGIGAITALGLAKLGVGYLVLYDSDIIDPENIPTQFLKMTDLGERKVASVAKMLKEFSDVEGVAYARHVGRITDIKATDILISSVDSIKARQDIFWNLLPRWSALTQPGWYLDARMGAEIFQLYTVTRGDHEWYKQDLMALDDDMVPDEPCTAKSTIYTALFAGAHVVHAVKRLVMGQHQPRLVAHNIKENKLVVP